MMLMADPVSMSAVCGVLLHKTSMKTGLVGFVCDGCKPPQGSVPSFDPSTRKKNVGDNHECDVLIVHICNIHFVSCKGNCWLHDFDDCK